VPLPKARRLQRVLKYIEKDDLIWENARSICERVLIRIKRT